MWIQISHPRHMGARRRNPLALMVAVLVLSFTQTATARSLASAILGSAVLAALMR